MSMQAYDDETKILSITVPVSFKRRKSRKTIVSPNGKNLKAILEAEGPKQDMTFVSALVKAFGWQEKLDSGKYASPKELAEKEKTEITHMYRLMRLTLLAPDIIQAIMDGQQPRALTLQNVVRGFPISWREQRAMFGFDDPV